MRAAGIVGYKNSGKTTLARALAQELSSRGYKLAAIKHTPHEIDLPGKDTAGHLESAGQVGFVSPDKSGVFWRGSKSLEQITPHFEADLLLLEGFKEEKTFPKILCLKGEPEDRNLLDGLAICAVGPASQMGAVDIPLFGADEVGRIANLVEKSAFKLPNLNCGGCGHESCYGLALEIMAGTKTMEDCVSLHPSTQVSVNGTPLPINPFISGLMQGAILGMLSELKGFSQGEIEIRIG